jgi:hypothetical protein
MKKQSEKQPVDDLFARKLGNMSLPPSPDGFARLQARMGQSKQETKLVFWRNPEMQRYMAAAACLLLVCLFGWLYWPSSDKSPIHGVRIATNQSGKSASKENIPTQKQVDQGKSVDNESIDNEAIPVIPDQDVATEQLAHENKAPNINKMNSSLADRTVDNHKPIRKSMPFSTNEPVFAQTSPPNTKAKPEVVKQEIIQPNLQSTTEQVAETKPIVKPVPAAERVLVVTIAEPEALVAARQAAITAVEEKSIVASADKPEKEAKTGGLWQQVKRIKQGEVFARQDSPNDDERGLLGRAYNGLKHSLDKDKSAKQ